MPLFFILLLCFLSVSCRFVVPGSSETAALEQGGAFAGGAPAWARVPGGKSNVLPARSGIMNRTHTIPEGMSMSSSANASSAMAPDVGRGFKREAGRDESDDEKLQRKVKVNVADEEDSSDASSVLKRIEYECPGVEQTVVDALKTESVRDRVRKYHSLTRHCPYSAEIWVLLAQEYKSLGRLADTRRCLQAALAIDPEHKKANELYDALGMPSEE